MENSTEKVSSFVNNLLAVTKELSRLTRSRECRKEFENDMKNSALNEKNCEMKDLSENTNENNNNQETASLKMEVYEDKDYDIEEIKFWNFITKNKSTKSNIIRTLVYTIPESNYTNSKTVIYIEDEKKEDNIVKNSNDDEKLNDPNQEKATQTEFKLKLNSKQSKIQNQLKSST